MKYKNYDNLLRKYKCRKKLKVYTTRLDDMNVITHNVKVSNIKAFIDTIIKESIPIYNKKSVLARPEPDVNKLVSFFILKYNIDLYNSIIKLNRNVKQRRTTQKKNAESYCDNKNTKNNCNESVKSPSYQKDLPKTMNTERNITDEEYVSSNNNTKFKITSKFPSETYVLIKDAYSQEIDIYYVNEIKEITQHYKSKIESNKHLEFYNEGCNSIKVNHCCWYRKIFDVILHSTIDYISKPHKCIPGNCKCCCKKYVTYVSNHMKAQKSIFNEPKHPAVLSKKSEANTLTLSVQESDNFIACHDNINIEELQKTHCSENNLTDTSISTLQKHEAWINNLLTLLKPSKSQNLIKKAFDYSPFVNSMKNSITFHKSEFLNYKRIIIVIHTQCVSQTHTREQYKIGPDGEIEEYHIEKLGVFENYSQKQICTLNNDCEYEKFAEIVCCWYTRKNFVDKFRLKLLPSSLKFIVSSQMFYEAKCRSCQVLSQSKMMFNNRIDLKLPGHVFHASDDVNKILNLQINFASTTESKSEIEKFVIGYSSLVAKTINHDMKSKPTVTCTNKIQNTPQSLSSLYPQINQTNTVNAVAVQQPVNANCSVDSPEVKKLVNNILEKFKGVQLIVNSKGKISAQFSSSIDNLNSEDIKMLIQIITQAQSELDALGPQIGNSQLKFCKPLELPQLAKNKSKPLENEIHQKFLTQKDNVIHSTDPLFHDNASTINEEDNITNEPATAINDTLHDNELSTLMKTKREHYLNSFENFLMIKQNTFMPIIKRVFSLVYVKEKETTKRKATHGEDMAKQIKTRRTRKKLKASKRKNNSKPENDGIEYVSTYQNSLTPNVVNSDDSVPLVSYNVDGLSEKSADPLLGINKNVLDFEYLMHRTETENKPSHIEVHDDRKDMPGPSKTLYTPQPVAMISTPVLENLLRAPKSTLHIENLQGAETNVLSSDISNTPVPAFSKTLGSALTSEMSVNIHDNLFKAEPLDDNVILGV